MFSLRDRALGGQRRLDMRRVDVSPGFDHLTVVSASTVELLCITTLQELL